MTINMKKGDGPLSFVKSDVITFKCSWPAATDYDLYALIAYRDGTYEYVAAFPAGKKTSGGFLSRHVSFEYPAKLVSRDGAVKHHGDARRGAGTATETMEVRLNPSILAVIPVAYSAQSNGTGSFRQYKVTTEILAGSEHIVVSADNANKDKTIYTLVPGMIVNEGEKFTVHALELYSARGSEFRPAVNVVNGDPIPVMDRGPKNAYK